MSVKSLPWSNIFFEPGAKLLIFTATTATIGLILAFWPNIYQVRALLLWLPIMLAVTGVVGLLCLLGDSVRYGMSRTQRLLVPFLAAVLAACVLSLHCLPLRDVHGLHPGNAHLLAWAVLVLPAFLIALAALACNIVFLHHCRSFSGNPRSLPS